MSTRRPLTAAVIAAVVGSLAVGTAGTPAAAEPSKDHAEDLRVATYNLSLNRASAGELEADLSTPDDPQARTVAEVIQRANPDVILLNEFDYVPNMRAADLFRDRWTKAEIATLADLLGRLTAGQPGDLA